MAFGPRSVALSPLSRLPPSRASGNAPPAATFLPQRKRALARRSWRRAVASPKIIRDARMIDPGPENRGEIASRGCFQRRPQLIGRKLLPRHRFQEAQQRASEIVTACPIFQRRKEQRRPVSAGLLLFAAEGRPAGRPAHHSARAGGPYHKPPAIARSPDGARLPRRESRLPGRPQTG